MSARNLDRKIYVYAVFFPEQGELLLRHRFPHVWRGAPGPSRLGNQAAATVEGPGLFAGQDLSMERENGTGLGGFSNKRRPLTEAVAATPVVMTRSLAAPLAWKPQNGC